MPENINVQENSPASEPPAQSAAAGDLYVIEPAVSRFTVQAFASGLLSAFGHDPKIAIRDLKGEIHYDPAQIQKSTMHLIIRADSLTVTDNIRDKDRREIEEEMRTKVLETAKYPEIIFDVPSVSVDKSDDQASLTLNGQLSLHGVTRPQKVLAKLSMMGEMLRAFGEFSLRQTDYGMKPVSAVGGGLKVKDEVRFTFDIAARKRG